MSKLYHQTDAETAEVILRTQRMKPGSGGLAGGGIYFATTPELTSRAHKKGVILEATVALGKILTLDATGDPTMTLQKLKSMGYGSVCIARAVSSGHEYVVYDPGQVMSIIRDGALPGGYQEGAAVYSSETAAFKCGNKIKYGERGVVRGRSDDGNGLEVKFDGGVLVDRRLDQVSTRKPADRNPPSCPSGGGDHVARRKGPSAGEVAAGTMYNTLVAAALCTIS